MNTSQSIVDTFELKFKTKPTIRIFSPGRVNIIGEHTDYNLGHVLPFATTKGIHFLFDKATSQSTSIYACDYQETYVIGENQKDAPFWAQYILQAIDALSVPIGNFQLVFGGDLPIGAGMSSSSALTCGFLMGINALFELDYTKEQLVTKAVKAERGHGVQGGIMDQYTIIKSKKDHAILLDCKTSQSEFLKLPTNLHFYLFNTNVKHNLLLTDYNQRTAECATILTKIKVYLPRLQGLCDLSLDEFRNFIANHPRILTALELKRTSFVIEENQRTLTAKNAITANNPTQLGQLMLESHVGLRDLYQVSCTELDWLVSFATDLPFILGSRMMGGGFGGCTINLATTQLPIDILDTIQKDYQTHFGIPLSIYKVESSDGAYIY